MMSAFDLCQFIFAIRLLVYSWTPVNICELHLVVTAVKPKWEIDNKSFNTEQPCLIKTVLLFPF